MRISVDTIQANKEFDSLRKQMGLTLRDVMYDQARLLGQHAIKVVAPGPEGGTAEQKRRGHAAVAGDIARIIVPIDGGLGSVEELEDLKNAGLLSDSARFFKTKRRAVYGVDRDLVKISPSMKEMERHHDKYRSKRTGRVTRAGTYTKDIGRWKFVDKMHVKASAAKRFIKHKQKKVGQLKAGFIPATEHFAMLAGVAPKAIPVWVKKQAKRMGSQVNAVNNRTGEGFLELINSVPYASSSISQNTINFLERVRQRDLEKHAIKRIRKVAKEHNERFARAA